LRPRQGYDGPFRNELLAALPAAAVDHIRPHLERVALQRRQILHERNVPLTHGYFIERGVASLMLRAGRRGALELHSVGRKDFVGLPVALGMMRSPHRCIVQVPGEAFRMEADHLRRAMGRNESFRQVLLGYIHVAMVHSSQLVVCSTCHALAQRLARWLLLAHDQLDRDELPVTHEFLSKALGVRRASVTLAMARMEEAGLLRRGRGQVTLLDRGGLEATTCECYRAITAEHDRALRYWVQAAPSQLAIASASN
jgi:CRP-like cAMP-binding protein